MIVNVNEPLWSVLKFTDRKFRAHAKLSFYKERYKVAYETARSDLRELASHKILKQEMHGKKVYFCQGRKFSAV